MAFKTFCAVALIVHVVKATSRAAGSIRLISIAHSRGKTACLVLCIQPTEQRWEDHRLRVYARLKLSFLSISAIEAWRPWATFKA